MYTFQDFNLRKQLNNSIADLGFSEPTAIQKATFNVVLSGKDILGIAQTGTGKTMAYLLPILEGLPFSNQLHPRVLILVPTRELVQQVVDEIEKLTKYMSVRTIGIFGGVNINTQRLRLAEGCDIVVATPGRLYDLVLSQSLAMKSLKKLVIDEVDVMLDLGFRPQLMSIFELLPEKRQNIMFSATMTLEVEELITNFFIAPVKIEIALSGTPLKNIQQSRYQVANFYTKVDLLRHILQDKTTFRKVIVFVGSKRLADKVYNELVEDYGSELGVIHSNKAQNTRFMTIDNFDAGHTRVLIATDIIARGLDLDKISHVINLDTPVFPENYMHRIGRTGRAEEIGFSILFSSENEIAAKDRIEKLMDYAIPVSNVPSEIKESKRLLPEEQPDDDVNNNPSRNERIVDPNAGFHEKKAKNSKVNLGGSYKADIAKKYKKPKTRGDKTYHSRQKRG